MCTGLGALSNLSFSSSAATCTTYPCASSITVTSYNGVDSSALSDLVNGKIASYDYQLTPVDVSQLPSSFQQISTPNTLYELVVNPENTTWSGISGFTGSAFNPFYFPQVRAALNWVMDRQSFVNTILGGAGVPILSVYGVSPDALTVANATVPYQSYVTENFALANSTIYNTLTANGAKYLNGKYYYNSLPIQVFLADRTDDPVRSEYEGIVSSNLAALGFTPVSEPMNLDIAIATVFTENPVNGTGGTPATPWDIYFGSFGNVFGYYGDPLQVCFDGANCAEVPYSDNLTGPFAAACDCANFAWNTLNATPPDVVALSDKLDVLNYQILYGNYSTPAQRTAVLANYTADEIAMGVNDWVATGLNVYGVNPSLVTGLDPVVTTSPVMNEQSFLTMSNPGGGGVNLGARYLSQYNINPLRIQGDAYSADLLTAVLPTITLAVPGTGYLLPNGYSLNVNSINPKGGIPIPSSAVLYNGTSDKWNNVTSGATAKSDITFNFAASVNHLGYADNETWNLADFLYPYLITVNATTPGNKIFDSEVASVDAPGLSNIVGLRLLNSTAFEVYSNYYFEDPTFAALTTIGDMLPTAIWQMPWTEYVAMSDVVGSGAYSWTAAGATAHHNTQLTLVASGPNGAQADVNAIKSDLMTRAGQNYLPSSLAELQAISGVTLISAGTEGAGYTDAANFITATGNTNAIIGDGPYYISNWQATTTPNFAVLSPNPDFKIAPYLNPALFTTAASISVSATVPATVTVGTAIPLTTLSTPLGSKVGTPQAGVNLTIQLVSGTTVASETKLFSGAGGAATYTVPNVATGSYTLVVYANSNISAIIRPQTYSTTILGPSSSTTSSVVTTSASTSVTTSSGASTSVTTTTTTTTTSTAASNTDLEVVAAIVVVIIIIAAVVLFVRRRPAPAPATTT
jgi:peptide/nickel transport system substrate-binding protein